MGFQFPKDINQASDPAVYGQLMTIGLCRQILGYALTQLHLAYVRVESFEAFNSEQTAQFSSTLDDIRNPIEVFYKGQLEGLDGNTEAPDEVKKRTMQYQLIATQTAATIGQATGDDWAGFLIQTTTYAVNRVAGNIVDRVGDALDAAANIPKNGLSALDKILEALGWIGYVALGVLVLLAISLAARLFKSGAKVSAGGVSL